MGAGRVGGVGNVGLMRHAVSGIAGKEFRQAGELIDFLRHHYNRAVLKPGESFMVYLATGRPLPFQRGTWVAHPGAQTITGVNKRSAFHLSDVPGKTPGVRMPGRWIRVSANENARPGSVDKVKLVTGEPHIGHPTNVDTMQDFTLRCSMS